MFSSYWNILNAAEQSIVVRTGPNRLSNVGCPRGNPLSAIEPLFSERFQRWERLKDMLSILKRCETSWSAFGGSGCEILLGR